MTSIALYIEGGGDSQAGKAALRQGFDQLLAPQKIAARARRLLWKTVLCGSRNEAFDAFVNATTKQTAKVVVLLVDSEGPVVETTSAGRVAHLETRDHWSFGGIAADRVHLMTECMEAWIAADPARLGEFYGQGFRAGVLPKRLLLDDEPKANLYAALESATRDTQKGSYGKIKHASKLLEKIRPQELAKRCRSFKQLTEWLDATIAADL